MKKRTRIYIMAIVSLVVVIAGAIFASCYAQQFMSAVSGSGDIYITTGADYQMVLDSLGEDGQHIKDMDRFDRFAVTAGLNKSVKPGRYVLKEGMSYRDVVRMFKGGTQTPVRLIFNNVRTIDRLAGSLSRQVEPDSLSILLSLSDPAFTQSYGFEPRTFIAMFIPNTYEIYWNSTAKSLCDRMKKEYDLFWSEDRLTKLEKTGLTQVQASVLASIVYEETKMSDEMPKVAGVYINRMRIGMPLQADPTVKFAIGDFSLRRILNVHLRVDSPYNTYIYKGLPPGPICMPSIKALDAVLDYDHNNYLYFCASPDFSGYHRFATNLADHSRNAREYAAALNRKGIR